MCNSCDTFFRKILVTVSRYIAPNGHFHDPVIFDSIHIFISPAFIRNRCILGYFFKLPNYSHFTDQSFSVSLDDSEKSGCGWVRASRWCSVNSLLTLTIMWALRGRIQDFLKGTRAAVFIYSGHRVRKSTSHTLLTMLQASSVFLNRKKKYLKHILKSCKLRNFTEEALKI